MSLLNLLATGKKNATQGAEAFLSLAFAQIKSEFASIEHLRVYRLARSGLVLWQSSEETPELGNFIALDGHSAYTKAINAPVFGAEEAILPLFGSGETFALLQVTYEAKPDEDSLSDLAQDLAVLLYNRHLESLLHQQIQVTSQLNAAESLVDVVRVLAETTVEAEQFIAVNVFEHAASGKISGARVVITANRRRVYPTSIPTGIKLASLERLQEFLDNDGDYLLSDIESESLFDEASKQWLREQKAKSLYFLPLRVDKRLYAFISLIDTARSLSFSPIEKQLYQNIAAQASAVIEKRQFLDAAEQSAAKSSEETRVLQRLNKLIATANSATTEAPILQQTSEALLEVTGVEHVGIVLIENERGFVVSEAPIKGILGVEVESGVGSVAEQVKASRKPLIVTDMDSESQMPSEARKVLKDLGIEAVIIIPMFDLAGNLLGTVGLDYYSKQERISADVVEIAQTFVSQVALSLQKLRLLADSQQQAKQLQKVTDFGQALRAHLGISEIVSNALRYSNELVDADYVGIILTDGLELRRVGTWWQKKSRVDTNAEVIDSETDSIALKVLESQEILRIDEIQAEWVWKHPLDKELQSILAAPILSAGKVLGVFEVGNMDARAYNAVDVAAFQQMSNQLAIALSNANTYAQSQKIARNKGLANDIIAKLQRQADVRDILQVTVQELGEALGAKRGRIRLGTGDKSK